VQRTKAIEPVTRVLGGQVASIDVQNLLYVDRQIDHHRLLVSKFQLASIRIAADDPHIGKMPVHFERRLGCKNLQRGCH
jgi:hypothetical protein